MYMMYYSNASLHLTQPRHNKKKHIFFFCVVLALARFYGN